MTTELEAVTNPHVGALALPPVAQVQEQLRTIRQFQAVVKTQLIDGVDYGVIPGTGNKPTLLKPGAEKMTRLLGLSDEYEIERIEDWDRPLFAYTIRCRLRHIATGVMVAEGVGEANSMESKWRYRWLWPGDIPEDRRAGLATRTVNTRNGQVTQYRVLNEEIYSELNTILKMGKKRAMVDAALSVGRLSDIFTQDLEENPQIAQVAPAAASATRTPQTATETGSEVCPQCGGRKRANYKLCYTCNQKAKEATQVVDAPPANVDTETGEILSYEELAAETDYHPAFDQGPESGEEPGAALPPDRLCPSCGNEKAPGVVVCKDCNAAGQTPEPESATSPDAGTEDPWTAFEQEVIDAGFTLHAILPQGSETIEAFEKIGGTIDIARRKLAEAKQVRDRKG